MATTTPRNGLVKPEGSEIGFAATTNQNMDTIDVGLDFNRYYRIDLTQFDVDKFYPVVFSKIEDAGNQILINVSRPNLNEDFPGAGACECVIRSLCHMWGHTHGQTEIVCDETGNNIISGFGQLNHIGSSVMYLRGGRKYHVRSNTYILNYESLGYEFALGTGSTYAKLYIQTDPNTIPPYENDPNSEYPQKLIWAVLSGVNQHVFINLWDTLELPKKIGINTDNPSYTLQLGLDSAAKPSSSTWSVFSDRRIKNDIENADLDRCIEIVKNIPLRRFAWNEEYVSDESIQNDRHKLGWVADEVESELPKSVIKARISGKNGKTVSDCKCMNADQIYAAMYGAVQKLISIVEQQGKKIERLEEKIKK